MRYQPRDIGARLVEIRKPIIEKDQKKAQYGLEQTMTESQRAMVAASLANLGRGANQHTQICGTSQSKAAELLNVSERSIQTANKVKTEGVPELIQAVQSGVVSVSAAANIAAISFNPNGLFHAC
jgi:hypothetical protein